MMLLIVDSCYCGYFNVLIYKKIYQVCHPVIPSHSFCISIYILYQYGAFVTIMNQYWYFTIV